MSVVSIETAAISKSRLKKGFNGDSINLNRRISSIDEMNSGYRAAGTVNPPCVCAVVSSVIRGVSAGAVTAFDDYSHRIYTHRTNAYKAFKKYTDDMAAVSAECGDKNLSIAEICIFSDRILVSSVGKARVYFCSAGKAELLSNNGEFMFSDLTDRGADGGYIVAFGADCADYADEKLVENATFGGKDIKAVGKSAFIALGKRAPEADITGVFFKIITADDADEAENAVPVVLKDENDSEEAEPSDESAIIDSQEKQTVGEDDISDENEPKIPVLSSEEEFDNTEEKKKYSGNKFKTLIPFIILLILVAGVCVYFAVTKGKDADTTLPDVSNAPAAVTAEDESVSRSDSVTAKAETTVKSETTTKNETTTKRASENTTRRTQSERTTERRTSPASTTAKPAETTEAPTTAKPAETTEAPTTSAPTTEAPTAPSTRVTDQGNEKPDV